MKLSIHELAYGGRGVGRSPEDGRAVFVPYVAAGETVEVEVVRTHKSYLEARLTAVTEPSPRRVTPPCPYYGRCGGCSYQHLDADEQRETKRRQVESVLRRVGRFEPPPVAATVPSPLDYGYRNRITVHVGPDAVGFFGHDAHGERLLVDIDHCPLAEPVVNEALARLRAKPRRLRREGHCNLRADAGHPRHGFEQTNDGAARELLALVTGMLPADTGGSRLIDAYCGAGFFARALRDRFARVVGLEWDERATAEAARHAAPHERYLTGDVAALLPAALADAGNCGEEVVLLLDPPSEGLAGPVRQTVADDPPADLLYVSCNPATLARDLGGWQARYEVLSVTPVDMFPQTAEIEVVARLRRK